jgi:hypothetical protein
VPQSQVVDFARELDVVEEFLARSGFRAAVIGGVALTAYGHPRMTLDLDLVTEAAAQDTPGGALFWCQSPST